MTELAKRDDYSVLGLGAGEVTDIVKSNIGDAGLNEWELDRIRIPSGGALSWSVPSLEGEEMVKELTGIIVAWRDSRAYWKVDFAEAGEGSAPDCQSPDAVQGYGDPGIKCELCPNAVWGSAPKGNGQACKLTRNIYLLRAGSLLPEVVVLSPTSIPPFRKYFQRLAQQGLPYYAVVTAIGLERAKSGGGINYSKAVPTVAERLGEEDVQSIRTYAETIAPSLLVTTPVEEDDDDSEAAQ